MVCCVQHGKLFGFHAQRGKFRPRLVELAGSNPAEEVTRCSTDAFKKCDKGNMKGAIEALSKLKGIGPATASGQCRYIQLCETV